MEDNVFKKLYDVDVSSKLKQKNGLNYLSWAASWASVKKAYPTATFRYYEQTISCTPDGMPNVTRFWFDDGKNAWVKVGVTIDGVEHVETLPIMDFKNKALPADQVDSMSANKALKRCLTKACAMHGLGLYVYEGEDLPEETKVANELQAACMELIQKKCALSAATKAKVAQICKEVLPEENGDPNLCEDNEKLKELKKKLMAVRKVIDEKEKK